MRYVWTDQGYNHCPDEKGTERINLWLCTFTNLTSYNHCPDEKGTERLVRPLLRGETMSYNHCPDEKGTERT